MKVLDRPSRALIGKTKIKLKQKREIKMKEIAKNNSGLPANFVAGMANVRVASKVAAQPEAGLYLKMGKDGIWSYGREDTPAEDGARYAINILTASHGFTGWGDKKHGNESTPLGDELVSVSEPLPTKASLPEIEGTWSQAGALQLACIEGDDKGAQLVWKTSAKGGLEAFGDLLAAFVAQQETGSTDIIPIVELDNTSYKHTTYGKIYKPVFKVVDWAPLDGAVPEAEEEESEAPKPEKKKKDKKNKKKKAEKAEPEAAEEQAETGQSDVETATPPRRRRRKAA
jgi:hypothetical protein